jgi:putative copper export protein
MIDVVLYIHILAATAWIGGALLLFLLGIFLKDRDAQKQTYEYLGPLYGYFEVFWLIVLLITGGILFVHFNLIDILTFDINESRLGYMMSHKLAYVAGITFLTIIHMRIALKTHNEERTTLQKIVSRGSSLMIFFLNLGILWFAIQLRHILS